jgi:tRNA-dihydrouridine synthase 2
VVVLNHSRRSLQNYLNRIPLLRPWFLLRYSVHGGMGAALLSTPDLLLDILRNSCKIRLLPEQPGTLHLASRILRTGVRCLTVHCRTRDMRSTTKALWERLGDIVQLGKRRGIPVICNGDGQGWNNWESIREETGVSSVMIARAAESNPSIFRPEGPVSNAEELVPNQFLPLVVYLGNHYSNTKFLLAQFKPSPRPISMMGKREKHEISQKVSAAKTIEDALAIWDLDMEEAREKGRKFVLELKEMLIKRDPKAYGEESSEIETTGEPDIWAQRKEAEDEGRVVDEPVNEGVIAQEEVDEEAMMNG